MSSCKILRQFSRGLIWTICATYFKNFRYFIKIANKMGLKNLREHTTPKQGLFWYTDIFQRQNVQGVNNTGRLSHKQTQSHLICTVTFVMLIKQNEIHPCLPRLNLFVSLNSLLRVSHIKSRERWQNTILRAVAAFRLTSCFYAQRGQCSRTERGRTCWFVWGGSGKQPAKAQ